MAQTVKHLPAMWETRVRFLGQEDPLEKEMATHSSILAWEMPWTEEPGRLQSMRLPSGVQPFLPLKKRNENSALLGAVSLCWGRYFSPGSLIHLL